MSTYAEVQEILRTFFPKGYKALPQHELHCHPSVLAELNALAPAEGLKLPGLESVGALYSISIYEHEDWAAGYWELRTNGEVSAHGLRAVVESREEETA